MTTRSTTVTTTNLQVNDNEFTRTPVATSVPNPIRSRSGRRPSGIRTCSEHINSGINANVQRDVVISVKEVDSKVLQGSHGVGDHRATARPAVLPDNPATTGTNARAAGLPQLQRKREVFRQHTW